MPGPVIRIGRWWRPEVRIRVCTHKGLRPVSAALLSVLAACAPATTEDRPLLEPASYAALPGWSADSHWEAVVAFGRSCKRLLRRPDGAQVGPQAIGGRTRDWREPCRAAAAIAAGDHRAARRFFERWFAPYRVSAGRGGDRGLFTGYFEPDLRGARRRRGRFTVPLYRPPPELVSVDLGAFNADLRGRRIVGKVVGGALRPFDSRRRIAAGALAGRGLELVWLDSAVDAFFLQIQGSGRIRLRDGSVMRVGFAGRNGHPYTSIGRKLIDRGALAADEVTMQSIRAWLAAHPAEARTVMAANASYIFFRELQGDGPVGAQGAPLTAGRSLAVDRRFLPLGAPVWLDTTDPLDPATPLRRLMVAQDTGSAIKGSVRGDVFWGHGKLAARRAGRMKQRGRYFLLLPRTVGPARRGPQS